MNWSPSIPSKMPDAKYAKPSAAQQSGSTTVTKQGDSEGSFVVNAMQQLAVLFTPHPDFDNWPITSMNTSSCGGRGGEDGVDRADGLSQAAGPAPA
jgi:hypothetical protein